MLTNMLLIAMLAYCKHAVHRILHDQVKLLQPAEMMVEADYNERGGLKNESNGEIQ